MRRGMEEEKEEKEKKEEKGGGDLKIPRTFSFSFRRVNQ